MTPLLSAYMLAARKSTSTGGVEIGLVIAFGVVFVFVWICSIICNAITRRDRAQLDAALDAAYVRWRRAVEANGGELPCFATPVRLEPDEECLYSSEGVVLCEPRAIRQGRYSGASVRVSRGISIHSGGFGSESHDEWRSIDSGRLTITSDRIVFCSNMQLRTIKLADIVTFQTAISQLAVSSGRRQKGMLFDKVHGRIVQDVLDAAINPEDDSSSSSEEREAGETIDDWPQDERQSSRDALRAAKYREREEAELAHVMSAMSNPKYRPPKRRSKRTQDLSDFQHLLTRVFADQVIEPAEAVEIRDWLLAHRVLPGDFSEALQLLPFVIEGTARAEIAERVYSSLLDCLKELRSRPSV